MRKMTTFLSFLLVLSLAIPATSMAGEDDVDALLEMARAGEKNAIELYYSALKKAEPKKEEALKIPARTIELPYGKITLDGGWLVPVEPKEIEDKDNPKGIEVPEREFISAVYVGEGRFEYEPPTETEKWSVNFNLTDLHPGKKHSDLDKIDVAIDGGAVICFEGKWRDLFLEGTEKGAIDDKSADKAEKMWKARGDLWQGDMARLKTLDTLTGKTRDGLTLDVAQKDLKGVPALSYIIDPLDTDHEQIQLYVARRYALNKDVVNWWTLASWFHPDDAEGKTARELGYSRLELPFDVQHYNLDMTVYRDGDAGAWGMNVTGELDMAFIEPTNTLMFSLMSYGENEWDPNKSFDEVKLSGSNRVTVSGVTDGEDNRLEYMHNGHVLTVKLDRVYETGEELTLRFKYGGLFIMTIKQPPPQTSLNDSRNLEGVDIINYRVPNDYPWFPQNQSHKDSYTFEWTLRLPKPMLAATSGTLLGMEEVGKFNVHTIKETTPVTFPAMLFGRFGVKENSPDYDAGEYKIRLYTHPGFEKDAQSFLDEAQGVIAFYEALFGPYPFDELDLAQMPIGIGYAQAPAGLVQMDGRTYISKTNLANWGYSEAALGIRDNFVPHEIAHEWWGHKAGWGSSRDQWVSETFAEYAAALYIEYREARKAGDLENTKGYETRKRHWGIDGNLGHTYSRTGPVWVGNRTRSRRTSTIYARGPLILDMIRENFGKEAVIKVMYSWCELAGKNDGKVVTEDLQYVLEQALPGVGFDEFMQKYIKGNEPLPDDPKAEKAEKLTGPKY